jgi:hypothetical protein
MVKAAVSPPETTTPPKPASCAAFTVTVAFVTVDVTKRARDVLDSGGTPT